MASPTRQSETESSMCITFTCFSLKPIEGSTLDSAPICAGDSPSITKASRRHLRIVDLGN